MTDRLNLMNIDLVAAKLRPTVYRIRRAVFPVNQGEFSSKWLRHILLCRPAVLIFDIRPTHCDRHREPKRQPGAAIDLPESSLDELHCRSRFGVHIRRPFAARHGGKASKMMDDSHSVRQLVGDGQGWFHEEHEHGGPIVP